MFENVPFKKDFVHNYNTAIKLGNELWCITTIQLSDLSRFARCANNVLFGQEYWAWDHMFHLVGKPASVSYAVSIWPSPPCFGSKQGCACSPQPTALPTALLLVQPAFNQPRRLVFLASNPWAVAPSMRLQWLTPQGGSPTCEIPFFFWVPSQAHSPPPDHFLPFLPDSAGRWMFPVASGCTRVFC